MKTILEPTHHMWWRRMGGNFHPFQLIPLAIALHMTKSRGAAWGFCCIKVLLSHCAWILLAPTLPSLWLSPGMGSQSQQAASLTGDTECPQVPIPPVLSYQFPSHSKINGIEQTFLELQGNCQAIFHLCVILYNHCAHKSSLTVTSMQSDRNWTQAVS